ncbi:glycosyltransferase family 2 protein [Xenophilus sp. Marseille-Q4582]|uniref:glycosyltransferase family 2 protein n=1 Tax=Xenophilus sp. Marseille-Q4582 TaxID=2866600 RepID=UPI001CE4A068|nr:glycosyltransferase family 2 protein [Xenophilus sp. Marseille-Q4582]
MVSPLSGAPVGRTISIVVPCFNEGHVIDAFLDRLRSVLAGLPELRAEIICIDDGSSDDTLARLQVQAGQDARMVVLELSRNFGKEAALTAGLEAATGNAVIPIDADLQHPPEVIEALVAKWQEGFDVVQARRRSRDTSSTGQRLGALLFYRLHNSLADPPLPRDVGDFRLMDRCVVDALRAMPERRRFMKGMFAWVGFRQTVVDFDVAPRAGGESAYGWRRLGGLALDGLMSFSNVPLTVWSYVGATTALLALVYGAWIVLKTLMFGVDVPGFASLLTAVLFMGGIQLLGIGVLGAYLGRVYDETKGRPIYVVRRRYGAAGAEDSHAP